MITIQQEVYTPELVPELTNVAMEHYNEIALYKDIPLNIDWDTYTALEEEGKTLLMTARDNGVLVGYALFIISINPHYKDHLYAYQDVIFVKKTNRKTMAGIGLKLLRQSEYTLQTMGVSVVQHHAKDSNDFGSILEKIGYNPVEKIYQKRI